MDLPVADGVYDPLAKANLARSIENEILARVAEPLAQMTRREGAGIYAIYYQGEYGPYQALADFNRTDAVGLPIYVGKAIPSGGSRGGLSTLAATGQALTNRLRQHSASIRAAENLNINDFTVRRLVVEDIFIPLGENMLIARFRPLWNGVIVGFGNNPPGQRRAAQFNSPWDILHPGRRPEASLGVNPMTEEDLLGRVADYFAGRALRPIRGSSKIDLSENADDG